MKIRRNDIPSENEEIKKMLELLKKINNNEEREEFKEIMKKFEEMEKEAKTTIRCTIILPLTAYPVKNENEMKRVIRRRARREF